MQYVPHTEYMFQVWLSHRQGILANQRRELSGLVARGRFGAGGGAPGTRIHPDAVATCLAN